MAKTLAELPANRWVEMKDPNRPELCRTWGHAVLDTGRAIASSSSAAATRLTAAATCSTSTCRPAAGSCPFAVEFPLGQLYSNTSYPEGFNINRRPWVTGHTYHNYNYDPLTKKMYFTGHTNECYVYDPDRVTGSAGSRSRRGCRTVVASLHAEPRADARRTRLLDRPGRAVSA